MNRRNFINSIIGFTTAAIIMPLDTILSFGKYNLAYKETDWIIPANMDAYIKQIFMDNCLKNGDGVYCTMMVSREELEKLGVNRPKDIPTEYYNSLKRDAFIALDDLIDSLIENGEMTKNILSKGK